MGLKLGRCSYLVKREAQTVRTRLLTNDASRTRRYVS
jgi:hypothetical protein